MHSPQADSLARKALLLALAQWLSAVARAVYALLLARLLGPGDYGIYAYGIALYLAFLPITLRDTDLKLSTIIGPRVSGWREKTFATGSLRILASLLATVVFALFLLGGVLNGSLKPLLLVFVVALFARSLNFWVEAVFVAREENATVLQQNAIFRLSEVFVGIVWLLLGGGLLGVILIHGASWLFQTGRGLVRLWMRMEGMRWQLPQPPYVSRSDVQLVLAGLAGGWVMQGPIILYPRFADSTLELGQVAVAFQILFLLSTIPWALADALLPALSRSVSRNDGRERDLMDLMPRLAIPAVTSIALMAFVLGPPVIDFILGADYQATGGMLGFLLLVMAPLSISQTLSRVVIAQGNLNGNLLSSAGGALGMTVCFELTAEPLGAQAGLLLACAVGYSVWSALLWRYAHIGKPGNWMGVIIKPMLLACLALGVYFLAANQGWPWLGMAVGLPALLVSSRIFGIITADEARFALGLVSRVPNKGGR